MKPSSSIAIIGAGICGLATAHRCLGINIKNITLFDSFVPGTNPRGIAAALMHPFPGLRAKPTPNYQRLCAKTLTLLQLAQQHSKDLIYSTCGLFRIASTPERYLNFQNAASGDSAVHFPADLDDYYPFKSAENETAKGLWIPGAIAVHLPRYLKGLWTYLQNQGVGFQQRKVDRAEDLLKNWDKVIMTSGFETARLAPDSSPLRPLRGQWFILEVPSRKESMTIALSDRAYAFPIPGEPGKIFAGATFEHTEELLASPNEQGRKILDDCRKLIAIPELKIVQFGSSLRCTSPDHLPVVKWISDRIGINTALGSKGLLRHAECADKLMDASCK